MARVCRKYPNEADGTGGQCGTAASSPNERAAGSASSVSVRTRECAFLATTRCLSRLLFVIDSTRCLAQAMAVSRAPTALAVYTRTIGALASQGDEAVSFSHSLYTGEIYFSKGKISTEERETNTGFSRTDAYQTPRLPLYCYIRTLFSHTAPR